MPPGYAELPHMPAWLCELSHTHTEAQALKVRVDWQQIERTSQANGAPAMTIALLFIVLTIWVTITGLAIASVRSL
jgi:hypothetical protein